MRDKERTGAGKIGDLGKGGVVYTYTDAAHKHAVTKLNGVQKYWYDANGNQVTRIVGSDTYALSYDAENRLTGVTKNGVSVAAFVYGPGGERIKGTVSGVTTVYIGNHYEVQGGTIRKYYYAGAQRVAMREGNALYWLLTDHLGSTAITANGTTGAWVGEVRYKAWGEERYTAGTTPTTYRYTGQRAEAGIGLYFYNARWYDPALSRFVQADTIQPDMGDPQLLNRYSYVRNGPTVRTDPSGHKACELGCPGDDYSDDELGEWYEDFTDAPKWYREGAGLPSDLPSAGEWVVYGAMGVALMAGGEAVAEGIEALPASFWVQGAMSAGSSAVGDVAGQFVTTGSVNWKKAAVAAGVGFLSGGVLGDVGVGDVGLRMVRGAVIAEVQYVWGSAEAEEGMSIQGHVSAILVGGSVGGLVRPGVAETFWRSTAIESITNVVQGMMQDTLNPQPR